MKKYLFYCILALLLLGLCSCQTDLGNPIEKPAESSEARWTETLTDTELVEDKWNICYPLEVGADNYPGYLKYLELHSNELPDDLINYNSLSFLGEFRAFWRIQPIFDNGIPTYWYEFPLDEEVCDFYGISPEENYLSLMIRHTGATDLSEYDAKNAGPYGPSVNPKDSYQPQYGIIYLSDFAAVFLLDGVEYTIWLPSRLNFVAILFAHDTIYREQNSDVPYEPDFLDRLCSPELHDIAAEFAQFMEESAVRNEEAVTDTANITDTLPLEE